jgi:hypothetical protein
MQAQTLLIGALFTPYHHKNRTLPLAQPSITTRMTPMHPRDSNHIAPVKGPAQTTTYKPRPTELFNNPANVLPSSDKPRKQGLIPDHKQLKERLAMARHIATHREKNTPHYKATPPFMLLTRHNSTISPSVAPPQ